MEEKRREARVEVNWPIRVFLDTGTIEGKAKDINLSGICIKCKDPIHLEGDISLSIFPPNCKPINVVGKIAWSDFYALDMDKNNIPVSMGLSFVELSVKDRDLLKQIIEIPIE